MGKNCARVLKTKGTVFSNTDRPSPVNNIFIFYWTSSFLSRKRDRNKVHSVCSFPRA